VGKSSPFIIGYLPAFRQIAFGDQLRIDMGEPAEHIRGDLKLQSLIDLRRIQRTNLAGKGSCFFM
jgi:hypothetical protein